MLSGCRWRVDCGEAVVAACPRSVLGTQGECPRLLGLSGRNYSAATGVLAVVAVLLAVWATASSGAKPPRLETYRNSFVTFRYPAAWSPSVWQARQPVYKTSVNRWRRYFAWLGDFQRLLPEPGAEGATGGQAN